MRVVSWNMNHWQRTPAQREEAWRYLREVLQADVALVQEASPPAKVTQCFRPIDAGSSGSAWGSAVVVLGAGLGLRPRARWPLPYPRHSAELPDSYPGTSAVADILDATGNVLFTAVSLYARFERAPSGEIYACATLHRTLSDLTAVLDTSRSSAPVLVAGDFNISTQAVTAETTLVDRDSARAAFARLRAFGLRSCFEVDRFRPPRLADCSCDEGDGCHHMRTHRNQNRIDSRATQLDYAWASEGIVSKLTVARAVDEDAAWSVSDHCPLLLEWS
jgi:exonuclease III